MKTLQVLLIALAATTVAAQLGSCPLLGKAYPATTSPSTTKAIRDARAASQQMLAAALQTGMTDFGPFDNSTTTFSIAVFSAHEKQPLFEFHHLADPATSTSRTLNSDTLYRIGSVSKIHAIYAILATLGNKYWNQPITIYVPELAALDRPRRNGVDWSEVTLGMLASHLSGVTRDYALRDMSTDPSSPLLALGFPPLDENQRIKCGSPGLEPCSRQESIDLLLRSRPITATSQTPIYSNAAYGLLALAAENITGKPFEHIFKESIVKPLGLKRTFWTLPATNDNAIIPGDASATWWNYDLAQDRAAGNAFQSLGDLTKVGQSILKSSILTDDVTRSWLKPAAHTNSLHGSVGKAWEIIRIDLPITPGSQSTRVVDLYSKAGGIGAYGGLLMLSPDHDMGFAILNASPRGPGFPGQIPVLAEAVLDMWLPAAEAAAREEAAAKFVARYEGTNQSSVVLSLYPDRPGLVISDWWLNGNDLLQLLGAGAGGSGLAAQLFPMETVGRNIRFRATLQVLRRDAPPVSGRTPQYLRPCSTAFLEVDTQRYGGISIDEFALTLGPNGKAERLEVPVLRSEPYHRLT